MATAEQRTPRKDKTITLDNGATAIEVKKRNAEIIHYKIDKQDAKKVRQYRWFCHNGYCCTMKNNKFWYLHWELMGKPKKGYVLYYLNGDRKDNRRSNLQTLTWRQRNLLLLYKREPNSSTGVIGVSRYENGLYVVAIGSGNKRRSFGIREDAVEARKSFERCLENQILRSTRLKIHLGHEE